MTEFPSPHFEYRLGALVGGMIALLIFVQTLFRVDREVAIAAAPHLSHAFENYQLGLAIVAIAVVIPGWNRARPGRSMLLLLMLVIALALSIVSKALVTPEIMRLRATGETHGSTFATVHGISMLIYTVEAVALLIAGVVMPATSAHRTIEPTTPVGAGT